jgi:hypothetical protein
MESTANLTIATPGTGQFAIAPSRGGGGRAAQAGAILAHERARKAATASREAAPADPMHKALAGAYRKLDLAWSKAHATVRIFDAT